MAVIEFPPNRCAKTDESSGIMEIVDDKRDDPIEYRMIRARQVEAETLAGYKEKQQAGQQDPGHLRVH